MLNNNHKSSNCQYAESLVAYLYDEADAAEKTAFESHLEKCASCAYELAEIGFARSAVHDWCVADFDFLPTPVFEIASPVVASTGKKQNSPSWFINWQQIFSLKPALAMAFLLVLIAFLGIAAFVFNLKNDDQIAEKLGNKNLSKSIASPTVERTVEPAKNEFNDNKSVKSERKETMLAARDEDRKSIPAKNVVVKASTESSSKVNPVKTVHKDVKPTPKNNGTSKSNVPALTVAADEEDDSIRLADLFDEIGTD